MVRIHDGKATEDGGDEWLWNEETGILRKANRGRFPPVSRELEQGIWLSTDWETILKYDDIRKLSEGQGAVIALIDTGIDLNNQALAAMAWTNSKEIPGDGIDNDSNGYVDDVNGWNTGDGSSLQDSYGHGTAMASIIWEIAPEARIMLLKINVDGEGSFTEGALLEALLYAKHNGANIVNLSLSIASSDELTSAIQQLWGAGAVIAAAAGNGGSASSVEFPASMAETVPVGAMCTETQVADWISPQGDALDVMAPGVAIPVYAIGGGQSYTTGTSISTAITSSVLAVLYGMDTGLGRDGLRNALIHGVRDLGSTGKDPVYGYGAIDGTNLYAYVTQTVGETSGSHAYTVGLHVPLKLCVLATNSYGEKPVYEWFALTAVAGGQSLPVYVFDGNNLVLVAGAIDLTQYVYPYSAGQVNAIATLSLGDLGLSEGDSLVYAYAYSNENGDIRYPEVVTIQAQK